MRTRDPFTNAGPVETSTISAAITPASGKPPFDWIVIASAGSGGLVVKDEGGVARSYTGLGLGEKLYGPFTEITSMTCSKIRYGYGIADDIPVPASGIPSTTSALGLVEMSVAPGVAAAPVAVGTNDPRVCHIEIPVDLNQTDGTFVESPVWIPGVAATITGATLSSPSSISQSNTNYNTFTLAIRDGAGGGASTVAAQVTKASGASFLAFQAVSLGAITNATTTATSQITFASTKASAGQAVTGTALLRITYTVP